jgi:hypothetical protein
MDVSEARRGQWLEIDHKEIARQRDKFDYRLSTPLLAAGAVAKPQAMNYLTTRLSF